SNSEGMQGTTGGSDEAIETSLVEEGADLADTASALELKSGKGSQNDAAKNQCARGRAKERVNGVAIGRGVMARPVVESSGRDAESFGQVALGGRIGIGEAVEGVEDNS